MTITIDPKLEERLREGAQAAGLTVEAYVERLLSADQAAEDELESLALDGLKSGDPIEVGPRRGIDADPAVSASVVPVRFGSLSPHYRAGQHSCGT